MYKHIPYNINIFAVKKLKSLSGWMINFDILFYINTFHFGKYTAVIIKSTT